MYVNLYVNVHFLKIVNVVKKSFNKKVKNVFEKMFIKNANFTM